MFPITKRNFLRLFGTVLMFISYTIAVWKYSEELIQLFRFRLLVITPYQIIWLIVVIILLKGLLYVPKNRISAGRVFEKYYKPVKNFSKKKLEAEVKKYNKGAVKAGFFWLSVIGTFALIYFGLALSIFWVYGFVILISVLDIVYISFWCPYRNWIVKNKCCNACRIYNWGLWMIFLPLAIIPNFWNCSVALLSVLIFLRWEYTHYKHPERFYEVSNANLVCENCEKADGFCKLKII